MNQRVLVCGSRHWIDLAAIRQALGAIKANEGIEVVIHGDARGADRLAGIAAAELGIPVLAFPANWAEHGRAAGAIRNQQMLTEGRPTLVLAFPTPESVGTWDMVGRARGANVRVIVYDTSPSGATGPAAPRLTQA